MSERTSPLTSLTYDEYKNNVSAEIIPGRFAMLGVTGAWAQENPEEAQRLAGAVADL